MMGWPLFVVAILLHVFWDALMDKPVIQFHITSLTSNRVMQLKLVKNSVEIIAN